VPSLAQEKARERERRARRKSASIVEYHTEIEALAAALSPKQRKLHADESQAVCVVCTRQSGKTSEALLLLVETMFLKPGSIAYVCLPTRDRAKEAFWDRWKAITAKFGLTEHHHHETLLETRAPNGSVARFIGVPDKKRANRVRSQSDDLVIIDEAASFADDILKYLIEDCAAPALGVRNGKLYVCSTPGMEPAGYLYRLYTDPKLEFSRHFLTMRDNPAWADPDAYLAKVRRQFGYDEDDPTYQREWLGRWVADLSLRVYKVTDENQIDAPPACDFHVMAVDLGATDESAICVLGWQEGSRTLYCVHEEADGELDITDVAERIKALQAIYQPLVTMVDGAAKQSVLELQNRHGVALEATPKAPGYKAPAIKQLNADFKRKAVMIPRGFAVIGQMRALQWAAKAIGVRENQGQPNDRCDAFLYAYLRALHYVEQIKQDEPERGSDAWFKREQQLIREAHEKRSTPVDPVDPFTDGSMDPW
jgi:phage terminase large subunit